MEWWMINSLNALSFGLILFLLSAGLVVSYSLLGIPNFAHGAFYLVGGYFGYSLSSLGFFHALWLAPLLTGALGYMVEALGLRRLRQADTHVPEMLLTFALAIFVVEILQMIWGRAPLQSYIPTDWHDRDWHLMGVRISFYRLFVISVAVILLLSLWWLAQRTVFGMVLRAALSQPDMVQCLGYPLAPLRAAVFSGAAALAGLAGVLGGNLLLLEPAAAPSMTALCFVVLVLGGVGSLRGAFIGAMAVAALHTYAAASTWHIGGVAITRVAGMLPYLALVLILYRRPQGLAGVRHTA